MNMKKIFILLGFIFFAFACAEARPYTDAAAANRIKRAAEKKVSRHLSEPALISAARNGNLRNVEALLASSPETVKVTDTYGNNVFHAAGNEEVFGLLWTRVGESVREELLRQRNRAGETPWMAHIAYGHEKLFLKYFPQSVLYRRLEQTSASLKGSGLDYSVAQIKRDELIKECSLGTQTLWVRADLFYKGSMADAQYAAYAKPMAAVRKMIGSVAPFLVR